jgi:2-desacetyl-2-hydroxyethyl bacteriochlorophyllide A dehydrogenase
MKTIVLQEPGRFVLTETDEPGQPGPGQALIRIRRIGICGTDIHAFRGRQPFFTYPRILGHELGVEVAALGADVDHLNIGDRCAVEPYLNCGHCIACRRGRTNCCTSLQCLGVHTDGGMRELLLVPAHKLHPSKKLSLEQLALVETLAIGAHAVARGQLEKGETVLVIGAGPIGLAVMQFARIEGVNLIGMDIDQRRLAFCREQIGVTHTVTADEKALDTIRELTGGDLPTAVFDATGNPQSMAQAFNFVAHSGRLALVGLFQGDLGFHDPDFHRREMTLLATRNALAADFRRIIGLIEDGRIDTGPWITHRGSLQEAAEMLPRCLDRDQGVLKAMLEA